MPGIGLRMAFISPNAPRMPPQEMGREFVEAERLDPLGNLVREAVRYGTSIGDRRRRVHRQSSRHVPQEPRLLGPGRGLKHPESNATDAEEFRLLDLRDRDKCIEATRDVQHVYALAADMGGMGFISKNHATILRSNALINLHTLEAARVTGVSRYLYTSSACIYPEHLQTETDAAPLKEEDAYPAQPQDAYEWEKLITEKACEYYRDQYGLEVRVVRFHNIYGPYGTHDCEKAPAAICRKVARRMTVRPLRSGVTTNRLGPSASSTTASRESSGS